MVESSAERIDEPLSAKDRNRHARTVHSHVHSSTLGSSFENFKKVDFYFITI